MAYKTKIPWCGSTWNFLRGCTPKSEGCENCYAKFMAHRFNKPGYWAHGLTVLRNGVPGWANVVHQVPEKLDEPLRWRRPQKIFPCSGSDIFHEDVPFEYIAAAYGVMVCADRHIFQVLTKRPERMLEFYEWLRMQADDIVQYLVARAAEATGRPDLRAPYDAQWPAPNIWAGCTTENANRLHERLAFLRQVPAAVRWISGEPLLGDLGDLTEYLAPIPMVKAIAHHNRTGHDCGGHGDTADCTECRMEFPAEPDIHWGVLGGESTTRARPCAMEWIERAAKQFCDAGIPVFIKQLGHVVVSEERAAETVEEANELRRASGFSERDDRWLWFAGLGDAKGEDPSEWPETYQDKQLFPGDPVPAWA